MITVNMREAKTRLSELVRAVEERNEVVVLCRDDREVAEIRRRAKRRPVRDLRPDPKLRVVQVRPTDPLESPTITPVERGWGTSVWNLCETCHTGVRRFQDPNAARNDMSQANYRPQAEDTTHEAERILIEGYRRMTPAEKMRRIAEDCLALEALVVSGIRARHPGASEDDVRRRLAELRLGRALARLAYSAADKPSAARDDG